MQYAFSRVPRGLQQISRRRRLEGREREGVLPETASRDALRVHTCFMRVCGLYGCSLGRADHLANRRFVPLTCRFCGISVPRTFLEVTLCLAPPSLTCEHASCVMSPRLPFLRPRSSPCAHTHSTTTAGTRESPMLMAYYRQGRCCSASGHGISSECLLWAKFLRLLVACLLRAALIPKHAQRLRSRVAWLPPTE